MDNFAALKQKVQLLGRLLGDGIKTAHGEPLFEKVEEIRQLSKSSRYGNEADRQRLSSVLHSLTDDELVPVARAFSHFLHLANTAEQLETTYAGADPSGDLDLVYQRLQAQQLDDEAIAAAIASLKIELVLTAHPTEVTRRTIIHKQLEISSCLRALDHSHLSSAERRDLQQRLRRLIAQIWHTPEIRNDRPSPVDEAKWGFAVIENSLWQAVPELLRALDGAQRRHLGRTLPLAASPVRFVSWMGGDRDGNPNVTATVTAEVLLLSRWKAADLYLNDVRALGEEMSMTEATPQLWELAGEVNEPYRAVLHRLELKLQHTLATLNDRLHDRPDSHEDIVESMDDVWDPLYACYESLHAKGMGLIADGSLLDILRRVRCFGSHLVRLDIRQESARHAEVFSELTRYLELGDYAQWDEAQRQAFLLAELAGKRPLLPRYWEPPASVREVLDTCAVVAAQPREALGAYVISMARQPSDVLAVKLLLRESGCAFNLPVAPLFETLDDLNNAGATVRQLLSMPVYRSLTEGRQMVMIGYSDSSKDAGVMAASWAQYKAQEQLIEICAAQHIDLTLFHGRGGTIGRGGAPAHAALLSQPPGSLQSGLRVTEQGEMIRFKLGLPGVAINTLKLYTSAVLDANLNPPPVPDPAWRERMEQLSVVSAAEYRRIVRETPEFIDYFRQATPESELGKLPLGSRPAKRNPQGGIESLRAIPWQFAWMQNRLMLPAWLGAGLALRRAIDAGAKHELETMCEAWPFFSTRIGMLEMVYSKADLYLAEHYDRQLVDNALWPLGSQLRDELRADIAAVLDIANEDHLMEDLPWAKQAVELRNVYTDPLNILQTELLTRDRADGSEQVKHALMITVGGIAAGMRNTG
jgi:phosphoenolpyruvate carboxylase